jgi:hypothetical protein
MRSFRSIAFVLLVLLFTSSEALSQELRDKNISEPFVAVVEASPEFLEGDVCRIVKIGEDIYVLASAYGVTSKLGFAARKQARRVADIEANRQMVAMLTGSTIASETFSESTIITENEKATFKSFFSDKTKEQIEGMLSGGVTTSGSWWFEADGERVFFVLRSLRFSVQGVSGGASPDASLGASAPGAGSKQDDGIFVVEVEGYADFLGNKSYSKTEALRAAQRDAVEQALGSLMKSETTVENGQVLRDRILSSTSGMVKSYDVLEEGPLDDGRYMVRIRAEVSLNELKRSAKQIGLLASEMGKPRVAIIPLETMNGQRLYYDSSPISSAMMGLFAADPYYMRPIDMYQAMITKRQQQPELWEKYQDLLAGDELDIRKFGELGLAADILVKGEVFSTDLGKDSDGVFNRYEGTVKFKVVWAGTGEVLGQILENVSANGDTPANAMVTMVKKISPRLNPLIDEMIKQFQDIANNGQRIVIDMNGVPEGRKGRALTRAFVKGMESISGVKQIENTLQTSDGRLNYNVIFRGTPSALKDFMLDMLDDQLGDWMDDNSYDFDLDMKGGSLLIKWRKDQ